MKKFFTLLLITLVGLQALAGSAAAQGGGILSFGIRPTQAFEDRPESFSYFSHILEPGSLIQDEALVINQGDLPITLKLYAADALTAQNGGTAFSAQGELAEGGSRGVSAWITLSSNEVSVAPGEEVAVPFSIRVPAEAGPGQYIAGLVVEAPPNAAGSTTQGQAQFAVSVIQRVGVAVLIEVPGERKPALEILGLRLEGQSEGGAEFVAQVRNRGNVLLASEGQLKIFSTAGEELTSVPVALDSLLPGDQAAFHIEAPVQLADSDYLISLALIYEGGRTASLEGVPIFVRNGQPVVEGQGGEEAEAPLVQVLAPVTGAPLLGELLDGLSPWAVSLFTAGTFVLLLVEILIWRKLFRS